MATLEIDFNCMCAFAPEEDAPGIGTMHVLMPATDGHQHHHGGDGGLGPARHVVRMLHPSFTAEGRSMEGWALVLGRGLADTTLQPEEPPLEEAVIVDLSHLTDRTLKHRLVEDRANPEVNARITLGVGRVLTALSEAPWKLNGTVVRMAHRVIWRMEGIIPDRPLKWVPLAPREDPPIHRLSDLGADADGVFRFSVYHVLESLLPLDPNGEPQLDADEVTDHFRAMYTLLEIDDPDSSLLPVIEPKTGGKVNCLTAKAVLEP